ncbi:MAG: hypothetical protein ACRD8A_01770 [Candidatus Acidiferrales bacterium]
MTFRETLLDNFAGDLEDHPRRGFLYLILGTAAMCLWVLTPPPGKLTVIPLILGLGSLTLLLKGLFLFRKSSEGLGLSDRDLAELSDPSHRKELPPIAIQAAQILQDFGTGAFLLWPLLHFGGAINPSWNKAPLLALFGCGAALFFLGLLIRRLASAQS